VNALGKVIARRRTRTYQIRDSSAPTFPLALVSNERFHQWGAIQRHTFPTVHEPIPDGQSGGLISVRGL
jgi:hypothetical protein